MVVAKGCAADVVVLITKPRAHLHRLSTTPSSPTLHTHYIDVRAPAVEQLWSLVHCVTTTTTTTATTTAIANLAIMIQQAPWLKELEKGLLLLENIAGEEAICLFVHIILFSESPQLPQRISKEPITTPFSKKGAIPIKGPQKVSLKGPKGPVSLKGAPKGTVTLKGPKGTVSLKGPPEGALALKGPQEGAFTFKRLSEKAWRSFQVTCRQWEP
nr:unnamed protein product [Digitaria exilis]